MARFFSVLEFVHNCFNSSEGGASFGENLEGGPGRPLLSPSRTNSNRSIYSITYRSLLLLLFFAIGTMATTPAWSAVRYGAPYLAGVAGITYCSKPTVSDAIACWWQAYQNYYPYAFPGCSYTLQRFADGSITNHFATMPLSGTCGGQGDIVGTATTVSDDKNGGRSSVCVGNPCNPANGNKYQSEQDYRGGEGVPGFVRSYNSLIDINVGLGSNWVSTLHSQLEIGSSFIMVRQQDGRGVPFTKNTSGQWQGDLDTKLTLTQDASGYTLSSLEGTIEHYSANGKLLSRIDRAGKTTTYGYDAGGRLVTVTGTFGGALTFAYDAYGHISTLTDPSGGVYAYGYDAKDNLIKVTYPDGKAKLYHYENATFPHHLTGISYVDASGNITRYATYAYDANGLAISTEHAGGQEKATLSYDSATQTTVTDGVGTSEVMTFAANLGVKNLLAKQNLADTKTLLQTFDANNNLTCKQDEEGRVTTWTYNATNQKLSETRGQGGTCAAPLATAATRTTTYQYLAPTLDLPTVIQSPSVYAGSFKTVTLGYGDSAHLNLPTRITQSGFTPAGAAVSRSVTLSYNAAGQVASLDGPRTDVNDVTTLTYYDCTSGGGCGQLQSVTNALGHATTYDSYDAAGRVTQLTDPNGTKTAYGYDPRGRVVAITQTAPGGAGRVTQYSYDAAGNVTFASLPSGLSLSYTYDAALYLRRVTDSLGNRIDYGYDLKGNRTQTYTYDPSGTLVRAVDTAFDARNHVSQVNRGGSITQLLADALGNLTQETDPNTVAASGTAATTNQYDALNRLFQTVDRISGVTHYGYDANDRVASVQAPNGAATQYTYDDLGNLLSEVSPDRGTLSYSYDAAGNVITVTDARGVVATYSYDALNRLTHVGYSGGSAEDVTYTYDSGATCSAGIGRLCSVTDESGSTQYGYDAFGNTLVQSHVELGVTYTTAYTYDAGNRVLSITGPDGRVVSYSRDPKGQVTSMTTTVNGASQPIINGRSYRPDGLLTAQAFGNGLNELRAYDIQGRLREQYLGAADTRLYAYDANGNLTSKQSLPEVAAFQYDALDRLTDELAGTDHNAFSYDSNGNRLSDLTNAGKTRDYVYAAAANRLQQLGAQTVTLDAAGHTLSDRNGARAFVYNNAGRLVQVTIDGTERGRYTYNAFGQRTRKIRTSAAGATRRFVYHYDLAGHLIAETRPNGKLVRSYLWAGDEPVAQIQNRPALGTEELAYLHTDALGTPRLATDSAQTVVWRFESQAFGTGKPDTDPDDDGTGTQVRLRFPGQYHDGESGLYYNWNRYYDPKTGRYITSDPTGLKGGLNTYVYVANNPLVNTDPSGLLSCTYQISTHTLSCENNLGQHFMTSGAKAGNGNCQDKSSCRNEPDKGPLPPGYYPIYPPGFVAKHPKWLFLDKPMGSPNPSNRDQFFIHPWGLSNGCISIYLNSNMDILDKWATQDGGGDLFVIQ
jgi:RHS repeat-associated protein